MAVSCQQFGDILSRRSEHLEDRILIGMHPTDYWPAHVSIGRFPAEQGTEHTFDRFENVWPDMTGPWKDITTQGCVGAPCDPDAKKIGMGFTRDSFRLQQKSFETDLFCWDLILSADRAKEQFAHFVRVLRRCTTIITGDRYRHEATRIAGYKWACANNTLVGITAYWDVTGTILNVSALPTSQIQGRHLQRRVNPQVLLGALEEPGKEVTGKLLSKASQPRLEFVTHNETLWNFNEGNPELTDHWRYREFEDASKFYAYSWSGTIGNYGIRCDSMPLRFVPLGITNADGTVQLQLVYPYINVGATEGIKEVLNPAYDTAPIEADFIWHRLAMTSLVRDTTSINPEMPFAMRDFGGKWQFAMDNLTCGTAVAKDALGNNITIPIPVDNTRRNKGKFIADFALSTRADFPEFAELFLSLREPALVVDKPICAAEPYPYPQDHNSANSVCPTADITITVTPVLNSATGTYEIPADSIECSGIKTVHLAITGTSTLTALVAQLNANLSALGVWAVSGSDVTLTTSACSTIGMPWEVA